MTRHIFNEKYSPSRRRATALSALALFGIILALLLLSPPYIHAAPPQSFIIHYLHTSEKQHWLFANLSVTVDDEDGLRNMLKDGAVLGLGVSIKVERVRSWWGNEEVRAEEMTSTILHDPLTRDFLVNMPGADGIKQYRDKNLTRLLHATWRNLSIPLISLDRLRAENPEGEYRIILDFSLQHKEVPPWLEKSLVFWSSNVVPTERVVLDYSLPDTQ